MMILEHPDTGEELRHEGSYRVAAKRDRAVLTGELPGFFLEMEAGRKAFRARLEEGADFKRYVVAKTESEGKQVSRAVLTVVGG